VVRLGARAISVEAHQGRVNAVTVETEDGASSKVAGDLFVSTLPVTELPSLFGGALGAGAAAAAGSLAWRHLWLFYAAVATDRASDKIQIYFTEKRYPFKRIYEPKNLIPDMASPGTTALCAEVCYSPGDAVDRADEQAVFSKVREGICEFYGLPPAGVRFLFSRRVPFAYAVYKTGYRQHLGTLASALFCLDNFISYGRQGSFRYNHLVDRIIDAAESALQYLDHADQGKRAVLKEPDAKSDYF
jgi:protoporphyrinogen oxidase